MKAKISIALLLSVFFWACNTNTPQSPDKPEEPSQNVQVEKCTSYMQWLLEDNEKIIQYSFCNGNSKDNPVFITVEKNMGDNTITLSDDIGLRFHDSYSVENKDNATVFHLNRKAFALKDTSSVSVKVQEHTRNLAPPLILGETSFDITLQTATPIYFIRPYSTDCNPIPLCYYDHMEIEWNPDNQNSTGVIAIAEWNGVLLNGFYGDTTVMHSYEMNDTGVGTLPNSIFNGMPDQALVNLWLIRANIITVTHEGHPVTVSNILQEINYNRDDFYRFITDHPEYIYYISHEFALASGAITLMPIYLIRNL